MPEGFIVEEVYAPEKAGTVVALTFDSQGRLVLSREDSTIITLLDPNGDGNFEERVFTEEITNSQGIFFDGADLLAVGNGPDSVAMYRVIDENNDSRGERIEIVARARGAMSDHGPHQPYFGPDGYLYWSVGNFSSLYEATAPLSPLRAYKDANLEVARTNGFAADTRAPGSVILRKDLQAENADWEMFAAGMRNHYDGAFNLTGELFTFDSDMEWDRDLPWFRDTRSVHVAPGGDFGWRSGNMKHPAYYIDDLPPMQDMGRGSPTGVTFYQSYSYPIEYWDTFLQSDWSRGRIILGKLTRDGATYAQDGSENFVFGTPLNVTDIEVGPDGNLYFALGGRDTEGGVFRVVYTGPNKPVRPSANTPLDRVLTMPQPRSAWSRQLALNTKQELGDANWQQSLTTEVRNTTASPERRTRALELLHVFGPGLDENTLIPLKNDPSWEIRAASAYYLGIKPKGRFRTTSNNALRTLAAYLHDADPMVQRRAAEALLRQGIHPSVEMPVSAIDDVMPLLASSDRFVRYAGRALLREMNRNDWQEAALAADKFPQAPEALLAFVQSMQSPYIKDLDRIVTRELELLRTQPSNDNLLMLLRTMQRTMLEDHGVIFGTRFFGPRRRDDDNTPPVGYEGIGKELLALFPTEDWRVNREIARILAYLEPPGTAAAIASQLNMTHNDQLQQIAYADAASFVESGWDDASINNMVAWFLKVNTEKWKGGRQFMSFINLMRDDFLKHIPDDKRPAATERIEAAQPQVAVMPGPGGRRLGLSAISDAELEEELVFNPGNFEGNFDIGAWAFEKALCISCHTFGPIGTEVGPDLTTINQRFNRQDLVTAIMKPSQTLSDLWQVETITKNNGDMVSGDVYNEDAQNLYVQIPAGPQVTIKRSDVKSRNVSTTSPMPEGLIQRLSNNEQRALLMLMEAGPEAIPDSVLARINGIKIDSSLR